MNKIELYSKIMTSAEKRISLNEILNLVSVWSHKKVSILYGWSWANEIDPTWATKEIPVTDILKDLSNKENLSGKTFDENDFTIFIDDNIEILFCHEKDVHVIFQNESEIINKILFILGISMQK